MANKINLGCEQTRGTFILSGKVTGRMSQNFYTGGNASNGKAWRRVNFGIEIEPEHVVYVQLFGSVQDNVYINKRTTVGGKTKTDTQSIPWAKRFDFEKDPKYKGYQTIGVTCGTTQALDERGNMRNVVKHVTAFDACSEALELNDGDSVFVRGNIEYTTYNDQHRVNYVPTQISLCRPVDFDDMDFQPNAHFTQPLVLMDVVPNKETDEYDVEALIVNYQTIESAEFHIAKEDKGIASTFKKLGKYVFVEMSGDIVVSGEVEEEEVDDAWGRPNKMKRVASPFVRKMMITGADKDSVDKEAYSEEIIEHAREVIAGIKNAKDDYGSKDDDWGKSLNKSSFDDEEEDDNFDLGL